jgi:GxxExxY protein
MKFEELTRDIISAAYKVHKMLGFDFLESVYKNAMIIELNNCHHQVEIEKPLTVFYEGKVVGDFYADLLVEGEIIVELKAVQHLVKEHEVQLVNYLNALKKEIGRLINFGPSGVEVKRKYRNFLTKVD